MKAILAIGFLTAFTILLIWRASVLETRLIRESEEPALIDKPAPDFSASTLEPYRWPTSVGRRMW
jgi:hypothetical protein